MLKKQWGLFQGYVTDSLTVNGLLTSILNHDQYSVKVKKKTITGVMQ